MDNGLGLQCIIVSLLMWGLYSLLLVDQVHVQLLLVVAVAVS